MSFAWLRRVDSEALTAHQFVQYDTFSAYSTMATTQADLHGKQDPNCHVPRILLGSAKLQCFSFAIPEVAQSLHNSEPPNPSRPQYTAQQSTTSPAASQTLGHMRPFWRALMAEFTDTVVGRSLVLLRRPGSNSATEASAVGHWKGGRVARHGTRYCTKRGHRRRRKKGSQS